MLLKWHYAQLQKVLECVCVCVCVWANSSLTDSITAKEHTNSAIYSTVIVRYKKL